MFSLHHSKITFYTLVSRHIMKRYLGLESKSHEGCLGHLSLALIALVLVLEFAALLRLPYGESRQGP